MKYEYSSRFAVFRFRSFRLCIFLGAIPTAIEATPKNMGE